MRVVLRRFFWGLRLIGWQLHVRIFAHVAFQDVEEIPTQPRERVTTHYEHRDWADGLHTRLPRLAAEQSDLSEIVSGSQLQY